MPSLDCVAGNDAGTTYPVDPGVTLGREKGAGLFLRDKGASRKHVQFEKAADGWHVVDLGSANGTKVNGKKIGRHKLAIGDVIEIGESKLKWADAAPTKPAAAPAAPPKPAAAPDPAPAAGVIKKKAPPPRIAGAVPSTPVAPAPAPEPPRTKPAPGKIKLSGLDDAIAKADAAGMGEAAKQRVDPNAAFAATVPDQPAASGGDVDWERKGVLTTALTTQNTANPLKFSFGQLSTGMQALIAVVLIAVAGFIVSGIYGMLGAGDPPARKPVPTPTATSSVR